MSQQSTFHITKEHFVGVINSLHEQFVKDKNSSEAFGQIFHAEAGFYDNSALINAVFSFLHEVFPKDEDGHSEILHYCYTLSFGKNGEEYESPEELYDRLMLAKDVIWLQTPDGPMWVPASEMIASTQFQFRTHQDPSKWQSTPEEMLESVERNKKYWQRMVSESAKSSPDENA